MSKVFDVAVYIFVNNVSWIVIKIYLLFPYLAFTDYLTYNLFL